MSNWDPDGLTEEADRALDLEAVCEACETTLEEDLERERNFFKYLRAGWTVDGRGRMHPPRLTASPEEETE